MSKWFLKESDDLIDISLSREIRRVRRFYFSRFDFIISFLAYSPILIYIIRNFITLLLDNSSLEQIWQNLTSQDSMNFYMSYAYTVTAIILSVKFISIMFLDQVGDKYICKYVAYLLRQVSKREYTWIDLQNLRVMAETDRSNAQNLGLIPNALLAALLAVFAFMASQSIDASTIQVVGLGAMLIALAYLQIVERSNAETIIIQSVNRIERERAALALYR